MKIREERLIQRINKKYRGLLFMAIILVGVISAILAVRALQMPVVIEEKVKVNTIEETTRFNYTIVALESVLYPSGGEVEADQVIFNSLAEALIITIDDTIDAVNPVSVVGMSAVTYRLESENMWKRAFPLIPQKNINSEGITHELLNERISIDTKEIYNFLNLVETETFARSNYLLVIIPEVKGKVYDDEKNFLYEIDNRQEIVFEITGQYLRYLGESKGLSLVESKIIEKDKSVAMAFSIFNIKMRIPLARYLFGSIALISAVLIVIGIYERFKVKREKAKEKDSIEKKNKDIIISIDKKIDLQTMIHIDVKKLKNLINLAEKKEETILKYEDCLKNRAYYYIVGPTCTYYYETSIESE